MLVTHLLDINYVGFSDIMHKQEVGYRSVGFLVNLWINVYVQMSGIKSTSECTAEGRPIS
jgi:hypothetical protein